MGWGGMGIVVKESKKMRWENGVGLVTGKAGEEMCKEWNREEKEREGNWGNGRKMGGRGGEDVPLAMVFRQR